MNATETRTSLRVRWMPYDGGAIDLFADGPEVYGTLTTEHAASSYGQPVIVLDDGTVCGPADVRTAQCIFPAENVFTPAYLAHLGDEAAAADSAPYSDHVQQPQVCAGEKFLPGIADLWRAAERAGFNMYLLL